MAMELTRVVAQTRADPIIGAELSVGAELSIGDYSSGGDLSNGAELSIGDQGSEGDQSPGESTAESAGGHVSPELLTSVTGAPALSQQCRDSLTRLQSAVEMSRSEVLQSGALQCLLQELEGGSRAVSRCEAPNTKQRVLQLR